MRNALQAWLVILLLPIQPATAVDVSLDLSCPSTATVGGSVDVGMVLENEECFDVSLPRASVAVMGNTDHSLGGAGTLGSPGTSASSIRRNLGTIPKQEPPESCQTFGPLGTPGVLGPLTINITDAAPASLDGSVAAIVVSIETIGVTETGETKRGLVSDSCLIQLKECGDAGGDTDGDTLCDNEDPCRLFKNTLPLVISGFSGIPDECLCGDFDGDGFHSATDAAAVNDCAAFLNFDCVPERDDVTPPFPPDGFYSATDADLINRVSAFVDPTYALKCARRPEGTCGGDTGVACF